MPAAPGRILLFGGSGQIGSALQRHASTLASPPQLRWIPWAQVNAEQLWANPSALARCIDEATAGWDAFDVVFACGATDPGADRGHLTGSNATFPLAVIDVVAGRDTRFLTFGTVFELFPAHAAGNAYLASKSALWTQLSARRALIEEGRALHLRLHTVYGGPPRPHMFVGQMVNALRQGTPFLMSRGQQLREYHHVDDIAAAVTNLLLREWHDGAGPLVLSAGQPVRLAELAESVFRSCGRPDLLRVGALTSAPTDNHDVVFPPSDPTLLPRYRDPLVAVPEYVRIHSRRDPTAPE